MERNERYMERNGSDMEGKFNHVERKLAASIVFAQTFRNEKRALVLPGLELGTSS